MVVVSVLRIASRFKRLADVPKPKSRYDRFPKNLRPFGWSTPAPTLSGETTPAPWRVSYADTALALLKKLSPHRDIYVDYESDTSKGRLQLWVGLRDNRDREDHTKRLWELVGTLQDAGCSVRVREAGDRVYVYLVDDLKKDVLG